MIECSFIIPAYNEEDFIVGTVQAIHQSCDASLEYEILVINNQSTDQTANLAQANDARVIDEEIRQISRVRNRGGQEAKGKYLIFIDADTQINKAVLDETLLHLRSGQAVGGGAALVLDQHLRKGDKLVTTIWGAISKTFNLAAGAYIYCLKEAWEEVGGFDETFYAAEDVQFSRDIKKWGHKREMKFVVVKAAVVTSARKLQWHSRWHILKSLFAAALIPGGLRSRKRLDFWYKRPKK